MISLDDKAWVKQAEDALLRARTVIQGNVRNSISIEHAKVAAMFVDMAIQQVHMAVGQAKESKPSV